MDIHNHIVATPVWVQYHKKNNKFYFFSYKSSMKVRSIEQGNTQFTVTIVNPNGYDVVKTDELPYLSMTGTMKIVNLENIPELNPIHIRLLEKYNGPKLERWIGDLILKLQVNP